MYNELDQQHLLSQLAQGDEQSFELIYDSFADKLYRYVFNRIRIKETTEEIVQEVFISLWTKRASQTITGSLESYLFSAAAYKIVDHIRSDSVRKQYVAEFIRFAGSRLDNAVEDTINLSDLEQRIETSIQALPEKCQEAFRLSRMHNMTIQQVADKMSISHRTVENYITQATKHLRGTLGEAGLILVIIQIMS